jgi:hypothetical protein
LLLRLSLLAVIIGVYGKDDIAVGNRFQEISMGV